MCIGGIRKEVLFLEVLQAYQMRVLSQRGRVVCGVAVVRGHGVWPPEPCQQGPAGASMKSEGREAVSWQTKYFYSFVFIKWKKESYGVLFLWCLVTTLKIK